MSAKSRSSERFGADDRFVCPKCGETMQLTRRTPNADLGESYEHQTFNCDKCSYELERTADVDGNPPEL